MKTVGEILKKARLEKGITLASISQETKIHIKYLQAIEDNDFSALPPSAFTKGFMRNYAKAVDLNPDNVLAIFRRDYDQDERGRIVPRSLSQPIKAPTNLFNPTTTTIALSAVIGVLIISFFIRQIILFRSAPGLNITSPPNQEQVSSPVTVSGTTNPEAAVTVNNRPVTVSESGEFDAQIPLSPGEHTLVVESTSRGGKSRTDQRIVFVTEEK